jgi:predicted kinase
MRSRSLTYSDAVRLLGEADSTVVTALDRLTGVAAGAVTVASVGTVDFFALRGELVKWGHLVAGEVRERTHGFGRFDRTQRLVAAHSIVVITAFFEAVDDVLADHPEVDVAAAELTAAEQVALSTRGRVNATYAQLVQALADTPPPLPAPHRPFEQVLDDLADYYAGLGGLLEQFLLGLRAFEHRGDSVGAALGDERLTGAAVARYEQAFRTLAVQAPEFGAWTGMIDSRATRATLRDIADGLSRQIAELCATSGGATTDAIRNGLSTLHTAQLDRPGIASPYAGDHVVMPSLGCGYVNPHGQVAVAGPTDKPATEQWWKDSEPVADVHAYLLAHLTTAQSVAGPLVVLGHPGSGKSALTRVLAARLPAADFLVIRVELRTIPVDTSIQAQIESALYQTVGEQVGWAELARRAGAAMPVVIMDGFDELLQATGLDQADYLDQIQRFQQREAELQRPVAVLVTSRIVVADRARFPDDTVVLRLAPFDEDQIRQWLAVWNTANEASLRSRSLRPLPDEIALAQDELATQPLLLLLLALYDAGGNALQRQSGGLGRTELYERLFTDFVQREVDRHQDGRSGDQRQADIDSEWRRLGAVALAILNRGGDVILEVELDSDLPHLLGSTDAARDGAGSLHRALTASQLLVGRFFFIHEARATRATGAPERSFEFLHATFGDFLAARLVVAAMVDLADEREHQQRRPQAVLDAGFFFAAISFVTMTRRAPLWEFCQGMIARLDAGQRGRCRDLVLALLPDAGHLHPTWSLAGYRPQHKTYAARHANFSANLVCFAVLLTDGAIEAAELVGQPAVNRWRRQTLLWFSQLDYEDRQRMWQSFRVYWRPGPVAPRLLVRIEDSADIGVYESLPWPPDQEPNAAPMLLGDVTVGGDSRVGRLLRRSAFVQTAHEVREFIYDLMPAWKLTRQRYEKLSVAGETSISAEGVLLQLLLVPCPEHDDHLRRDLYTTALRIGEPRFQQLVLRQLADDAKQLSDESVRAITSGFPELPNETPFDLLAPIIAALAARPAGAEGPMHAHRAFIRLQHIVAYTQGSRPAAAYEELQEAFRQADIPVPSWANLGNATRAPAPSVSNA